VRSPCPSPLSSAAHAAPRAASGRQASDLPLGGLCALWRAAPRASARGAVLVGAGAQLFTYP